MPNAGLSDPINKLGEGVVCPPVIPGAISGLAVYAMTLLWHHSADAHLHGMMVVVVVVSCNKMNTETEDMKPGVNLRTRVSFTCKFNGVRIQLEYEIPVECDQYPYTNTYMRDTHTYLSFRDQTHKYTLHSHHDRVNGKCQQHAGHGRRSFGPSPVSV